VAQARRQLASAIALPPVPPMTATSKNQHPESSAILP
jgi:hypothetical protein